jgi:nicotinamidase-related amidase
MDVQRCLVDAIDPQRRVVANIAIAVDAARAASIPVVYAVVRLRPAPVGVHPRNAAFVGAAGSGMFDEGSHLAEIDPAVAPRSGDAVVTKRRVSAFAGSDLDIVLRSAGIETLVLGGLTTGGVVLSTLREAADRDFEVVVLADACSDPDDEVHRVLTTKLFPPQARVVDTASWTAEIDGR